MSECQISQTTRVSVRINAVSSEANSIYPTLRFEVEFTHRGPDSVSLFNFIGRVFVIRGDSYYLGNLITDVPVLKLTQGGQSPMGFYLTLDHYGLSQIEKLRDKGDLTLNCQIYFAYRTSAQQDLWGQVSVKYKIAKSEWVERLLTDFQHKGVFLLEVPKLVDGEFAEAIQYLDQAHRQLAMGEYSSVLVDCQKALEKVKEVIKKKGLAKEGEIDFGRLVSDSPTSAEALDAIWRKLFSFLQPGGRHVGRTINKEDAEFAVLVTYGLTNLLVKNSG